MAELQVGPCTNLSELIAVLKVPNFIYTSKVTVGFSLIMDEQRKIISEHTKVSAAKEKKKNQSAEERLFLASMKCKSKNKRLFFSFEPCS